MPVYESGLNIANFDVAYASITSPVSITATSSATGNTCIAFTASIANEGDYYVMVYTPALTKGTTNIDVELYDGATFLQSLSGHLTASTVHPGGFLTAKVHLSQASHSLKVTAFVDGGTGTFGAGAGTTGADPPAYARCFAA
jgi:hypothetical protein